MLEAISDTFNALPPGWRVIAYILILSVALIIAWLIMWGWTAASFLAGDYICLFLGSTFIIFGVAEIFIIDNGYIEGGLFYTVIGALYISPVGYKWARIEKARRRKNLAAMMKQVPGAGIPQHNENSLP